jgi:hypothetical protein
MPGPLTRAQLVPQWTHAYCKLAQFIHLHKEW